MSELEKLQRAAYQSKRRKLIVLQYIIAAVLVLATLFTLFAYLKLNKNTYVYYTEKGSADYKVYLADNKFYGEEYLNGDRAYVASLIDHVLVDFAYALKMDTDDVDYKYNYKINAVVNVTDSRSGAPIYDPEYIIAAESNKNASQSTLNISKQVDIDYDFYNDIAKDFIEAYSVTDCTATLVVKMYVDVVGKSEQFAADNSNEYTQQISIPLLEPTVKITSKASVPQGEPRILACDSTAKDLYKLFSFIFGVLAVLVFFGTGVFVVITRDKHIDYARRVNRLLSSYRSYIQRITNPFDFENYQVLNVATFKELLEIRDTIQIPVLMYENEDRTKAQFFIVSPSNILYLYELKVEDFEDKEPEIIIIKGETAEEPEIKETETVSEQTVEAAVLVGLALEEAVAEEPAAEETVVEEAVAEETVAEETVAEETVVEEPVAEEAVAEETVAEETVAEETVVEEAVAEEPVVEEAVVEETVAEETVAEEPAAEEPAVEEAVAEETVAEEKKFVDPVEVIDIIWPEDMGEKSNKIYTYDPNGEIINKEDIVAVPTRDEGKQREIIREVEVVKGNYTMEKSELRKPLKKIISVVKRKVQGMLTTDLETLAQKKAKNDKK